MAPTVQRKRSNPDSALEGLMAVLDQEAGQRQTVRLLALAERVLRQDGSHPGAPIVSGPLLPSLMPGRKIAGLPAKGVLLS